MSSLPPNAEAAASIPSDLSRSVTSRAPGDALKQALIATVVVLGWMAAGWGFRLSTNAYLLLGVPIVAAYQRLVRRRPLRALWRFDGSPMAWGRRAIVASVGVAAVPVFLLATLDAAPASGGLDVSVAGWLLCAIFGSLGAGWWIANWRAAGRAQTSEQVTLMLAGIATGGVMFWVSGVRQGLHLEPGIAGNAGGFVMNFLPLLGATFVLEEVAFRGAFDQAISGGSRVIDFKAICSAGYVGLLWGLWHLPMPMLGTLNPTLVTQVLVAQTSLGIVLSTLARRAGNLGPSSVMHAAIDAWRNLWAAG